MSLESGHRLAHYEILSPLGRGGMGEVYRARDGKLGRDVAIKVLPGEFARDQERLRRFEREAKVLASLNHPNIAAIYGLEQDSDIQYLVLELVPGETLAERIARGPIPVEEALAIAGQIIDALEEAHEHGIVHRDLKPANIKITPGDKVKVLDFGLAKAFAEETPGADSSMSPTRLRQGYGGADATQEGVLLGTAAYMSPEQAKGKRVDKRTDVWAFAAVLYEMLTGRRAFDGEDVSDTLAAVLREEPRFDALPSAVPPAVRTALARCLEKSAQKRVRDIGDVKLAMEGGFESSGRAFSPSTSLRFGPAIALAVLTGLGVWALTRSPEKPPLVARFVATAAPSPSFDSGGEQHDLALSPDGTRLVYRGGVPGQRFLYERRLDRIEVTRIEGTLGGQSPFFSPDGEWLGFYAGAELKKLSVFGGAPVTIATVRSPIRGASWGPDGSIVFGDANTQLLYRVPAAGGDPVALLEPEEGSRFRWPEFLPGGKALLVSTFDPNNANSQIAALDLETSQVKALLSPGTFPRYSRTGHVVYGGGDGTVRAVPFDLDRLEVTGDPVPILQDVLTKPAGAIAFALAENGALVYATQRARRRATLVWIDRSGREEPVDTEPRMFDFPRLSPDGRRVAVEVNDGGNADLYVVDLERGTAVRLTLSPEEDTSPMWTPDGSALVFGSTRDGGGIFRIAADGAGDVERLAEGVGVSVPLPHAWSQDGKRLVFYESGGPAIGDIYALELESSRVEPVLASPELQEAHPSVSPDGRWLAYTGNDSGFMEVYARPFPDVGGGRELISTAGGNEPLWSLDGRELFYWDDATSSMMAVPVTLEPTFRAGTPTRLFEGDYLFPQAGRHYDVSADGKRFLMVKAVIEDDDQALGRGQIIYVQNWLAELERRVPSR